MTKFTTNKKKNKNKIKKKAKEDFSLSLQNLRQEFLLLLYLLIYLLNLYDAFPTKEL